jgi:hypothetical protein
MNSRGRRAAIVFSLVLKDLLEISRSRLCIAAGPVAVVVMIMMFWLLPARNPFEYISVGLSPAWLAEVADATLEAARTGRPGTHESVLADGIRIVPFADEQSLRAVLSGEGAPAWQNQIAAGIAFPDDFLTASRTGGRTIVRVYAREGFPEWMQASLAGAVREVSYALRAAGRGTHPVEAFPVSLPAREAVTLGEDCEGRLVPQGVLIRPMLVVLILAVATTLLAGLVANEIVYQTATAILVTPARAVDIVAAKGVVGTLLCTVQAFVFLLGTWRFEENWPPVIVLVVLGGLLFSSVGLIAGATGKGHVDSMVRAMLLSMPLTIPLFSAFVPDGHSLLAKAMPSYGLIEGFRSVTVYDKGWPDVALYAGMVAAWDAALLGIGAALLHRRVRTP